MNRTRWWIAALMCGFSVVNYFDRTILSVAAPGMMRELAISPEQMGIVFSAFQISYTLLMTPGGRWADRFGPRNVLTVMGLGAGLLTALMPLGGIPGLDQVLGVISVLVIVRLGFGAFTAPLFPATARMNAEWIPPHRRTAIQSVINAGAGLGGALSPMLFTAMIAIHGWRTSFVLAGAASAVLALVWYFSVPGHGAAQRQAESRPDWGPLLRDSNIRWLIGGFAALDYFEYIFFYWLFYYLGEVRKLPAADTAFYATFPFLAWTVMMPLGGWLTDRRVARHGATTGMRTIAIGCILVSVACLVGALQASGTTVLVALLSLAFGFCAIADVTFWSAAIHIGGSRAGAAGGLMNTGGNLGGGIAPALTPVIASHYGWSAGLYFGAAVALIAVVAWLRIKMEP